MKKRYLLNIEGTIPNTTKEVNINLNGKNLIITGSNGSGKTSFLREIHKKTDLLIVQKKQADLPSLQKNYENQKRHWENNTQKGTTQYDQHKRATEKAKAALDEVLNGLKISIQDNLELSSLYDDKIAVIKLFQANRTAQIQHADTARGLATEANNMQQQNNNQNLGNSLEQHLVNLKNRRSLALSEDHDDQLAEKIS